MSEGLIRVRDFAAKCGCTPQNIYGHLKTYASELEGHTYQGVGRQGILLDGEAQEFLRSVMYPKEIGEANLVGEINELRGELLRLGVESTRLASELAQTESQRDKAEFEVKQLQKLLKAAQEEEEQQKLDLAEANEKLEKATQEAESNAAEAARLRDELADLKNRNWIQRLLRRGE